jgi:signal transduction histidine kinase
MHRSIDEAMAEAATSFVAVQDSLREMFTAALTHDFRGPLSSALNNLQLMRGELDAGERERFAKRTAQNLRRVSCMISSLLDASRSNAGERLLLDAGDCEVREMLDEIIGDLEPRAQHRVLLYMPAAIQRSGTARKSAARSTTWLTTPSSIRTPTAPSTCVPWSLTGASRFLCTTMAIPFRRRISRRCSGRTRRTAAAERSGKAGWGLGLVQVQAVAEAHGGVVNLESASQTGTTFTLDLLRDVRELRQS